MTRTLILACAATLAAAALPAHAQLPVPGLPDLTVVAKHDTEPVVLKGAVFGTWSVPANQTFQPPLMDLVDCPPGTDTNTCDHNEYAPPAVDTASDSVQGVPVDRLLGYRWNGTRFEQIPFQVDEMFTRYLSNEASGFSIYSGQDQHTTYAFDREGFRYTKSDPSDPCKAIPDSPVMKDPVKGLDSNDEVAFMASDAGPRAPSSAIRPAGIDGVRQVEIVNPQTGASSYVYVMLARADGPRAAFDATNGYVHYERDANADTFVFSQSDYSNYGNAAQGVYCTPDGQVAGTGRRRPLDTATVTTGRYRFRYDGRWLMSQLRIKQADGSYGPDLIDRWKARAFQQDPSSNTPCCGYEEEDTHWGGSSTLLGERVGPVRAIRETWGADSGTNVIRQETFYRDELRQKTWLRVHVIPPLDGIYAQWDFNAGVVDRFYNSRNPAGVPIDGRNDEAFGNLDDPCNPHYDSNDTSQLDQTYRTLYAELMGCQVSPYHQSVDVTDPGFGQPNVELDWGVTSGPYGSVVDRITSEATDLTPGGAAQSLVAEPYYRDDSCFDDGTGTDPGPRLNLTLDGGTNDPATAADGTPRRCWHPGDTDPTGTDHYYQGSIGTHGLHLLFQVDSDNARLTEPVDEIVSDWRMVMLPGRADATAGEQYGRGFEKPLLPLVTDANFAAPTGPGQQQPPPGDTGAGPEQVAGGGQPTGSGDATTSGARGGGADTTAPVILSASVKPRTVRRRRGATLRYRLSEQARLTVTIQRRAGRRYVSAARLSAASKKGANTRRLVTRRLRPGRYRAVLVATDAAGNPSKRRVLTFQVLR